MNHAKKTMQRESNHCVNRDVLVFTGVFLPGVKGGGPIRSLQVMMDRLPPNVMIYMITADRDLGDSHPYSGLSSQVIGRGKHRVFYWNSRSVRSWWRLLKLLRARRYDLLYLNSLWSPLFTMLPVALSLGVIHTRQLLIAPRGELSPGALGLKRFKKQFALATFGRLLAVRSPLWHATTDLELAHVKDHFPGATVIMQSDSTGPPPIPAEPSVETARFVFISRISPMKNLPFLLRALRGCQESLSLDIYGPLEDSRHWEECERAIAQLPANVNVEYRGILSMDAVQPTFARYDAFLFPTLGENFGHVVAESLASGCPVVCSTHTPWTELLREGCGAALDIGDPTIWTQEIDIRAAQSVRHRTANKQRTLDLYASSRDSQKSSTAIEAALARAAS